jgi:hypothetical protein
VFFLPFLGWEKVTFTHATTLSRVGAKSMTGIYWYVLRICLKLKRIQFEVDFYQFLTLPKPNKSGLGRLYQKSESTE